MFLGNAIVYSVFPTLMRLTESPPKMSYLQRFRTNNASTTGKYSMQHIFISEDLCQKGPAHGISNT